MKVSKTLCIGLSHVHNIQEVMASEGITWAQATRKLLGLGLQKYAELQKATTVVVTTTTSEKEKPPPIEKIKWDKVGNKKKEVK